MDGEVRDNGGGALVIQLSSKIYYRKKLQSDSVDATMCAGSLPTKLRQDFIDLLRRHTADSTTPILLKKVG